MYELTDKAIELLNKRAARRFDRAKSEAALLKFDELSVIKTTKALYQKLTGDNKEIFLELAQEQYRKTEPHGKAAPDLKWLLAILAAYDAVTRYIYDNEVERKRDRTAEAINSSTAKVTEYRRGLGYWSQMTAQYAETVTDRATLQAYQDAGIKKVRWHTQIDGKECETCRERDGKIYPIHQLPPKSHWRCRCWFEPVK